MISTNTLKFNSILFEKNFSNFSIQNNNYNSNSFLLKKNEIYSSNEIQNVFSQTTQENFSFFTTKTQEHEGEQQQQQEEQETDFNTENINEKFHQFLKEKILQNPIIYLLILRIFSFYIYKKSRKFRKFAHEHLLPSLKKILKDKKIYSLFLNGLILVPEEIKNSYKYEDEEEEGKDKNGIHYNDIDDEIEPHELLVNLFDFMKTIFQSTKIIEAIPSNLKLSHKIGLQIAAYFISTLGSNIGGLTNEYIKQKMNEDNENISKYIQNKDIHHNLDLYQSHGLAFEGLMYPDFKIWKIPFWIIPAVSFAFNTVGTIQSTVLSSPSILPKNLKHLKAYKIPSHSAQNVGSMISSLITVRLMNKVFKQ